MQNENRYRWRAVLLVFVVGLAVIAVLRISSAAGTANAPAPQQDIIRVENRISQLEQRLFAIETGLRTLEQKSRITSATSQDVNPDIALLRSSIRALQQRLADDECALAKLDERTLAPAARKRSGAADPCRANVDTPLHLLHRRE